MTDVTDGGDDVYPDDLEQDLHSDIAVIGRQRVAEYVRAQREIIGETAVGVSILSTLSTLSTLSILFIISILSIIFI